MRSGATRRFGAEVRLVRSMSDDEDRSASASLDQTRQRRPSGASGTSSDSEGDAVRAVGRLGVGDEASG